MARTSQRWDSQRQPPPWGHLALQVMTHRQPGHHLAAELGLGQVRATPGRSPISYCPHSQLLGSLRPPPHGRPFCFSAHHLCPATRASEH